MHVEFSAGPKRHSFTPQHENLHHYNCWYNKLVFCTTFVATEDLYLQNPLARAPSRTVTTTESLENQTISKFTSHRNQWIQHPSPLTSQTNLRFPSHVDPVLPNSACNYRAPLHPALPHFPRNKTCPSLPMPVAFSSPREEKCRARVRKRSTGSLTKTNRLSSGGSGAS